MAMRKRGGGGGRGMGLLASILGAPEQNPYFGMEAGDVPYDMDVDPSLLTQQPYVEDNIWGHIQGSPATRANSSYAQSLERGEMMFQRQVEAARQKALIDAEVEAQKRLMDFQDAQPGGLVEQQNAARYRSQIAGENMQRENAVTNLYPTVEGDMRAAYGAGPLAATAPSNVRGGIIDLINRQGLKNVTENGLINAQSAADKGQADAALARFQAEQAPANMELWRQGQAISQQSGSLANQEAEANRPWWGSKAITSPLVFGDGRFLSTVPGQEAKPAFGIPGKDGYIPGSPAIPATPIMGGMPGAFTIPGMGAFVPRKTPGVVAEPGMTFLDAAPKDAKPMQAPKQPEVKSGSIFGDAVDFMRAQGGKRENESWAEYEKRKARK